MVLREGKYSVHIWESGGRDQIVGDATKSPELENHQLWGTDY
jgi:hypothetical protein